MSLVVVLGLAFTATLLPLLAVLAVVLSLVLPGRWRVLRLLGFALVYLLVETVARPVPWTMIARRIARPSVASPPRRP